MKIKHLSLIFFMGFIAITTASCSVNTNSQTNNTSEVKTEETHSNTTPENITTNTGDTSNTGETTPAVEKVTVTFNTNGGSSIAPVEINKGTKVTKPGDPTKAEDATAKYTFAGWFKDAACTTAFDFSSNIDSNTIVYAKWDTQGKFTVSFNTKGGSDVTAQTVLAGEKAKQPTTDPTKANDATNSYTFAGWFKDEACTQAFDFNTAISAATVIYAGWTATPLEFTVTFNTNGGSNVTAQTVTAGGKAKQPATDPTKTEDTTAKYTFAGWFKDAACTQAFDFNAEITEATTIYAGWTITHKYTIEFETNGGSKVSTMTVYEGETITLPNNPVKSSTNKASYNFEGWYTNESLTSRFDESKPITSNIKLYAKWDEILNKYTVKFNTNSGSSISDLENVEYGSKITEPTEPSKASDGNYSYSFAGWYKDSSLTEEYDFTKDTITDNITLYAKYNSTPLVIQYNVYFYDGSNEITTLRKKVNNGATITSPEAPYKANYSFDNWYSNEACTELFNFSTVITENTKIYAKYNANSSSSSNIQINECIGYREGIHIELSAIQGVTVDGYIVSYKPSSSADYTTINSNLIRINNSTIIIDIVGLVADTYSVKIEANAQIETINNIYVTEADRSGYAYWNRTEGIGAYNKDGSLKNGADVIYVTDENKNTITYNGKTGLVNILKASHSNPLCIRVIGSIKTCQFNEVNYTSTPQTADLITEQSNSLGGTKTGYKASEIIDNDWNSYSNDEAKGITELNGLDSKVSYSSGEFDTAWNNCSISGQSNITIEGIGDDAEIFQWGFTWSKCNSIEIKNLTFTDYPEDACSFQGGSNSDMNYGNYWIHNCTFNRGKNNWDFTYEQDKHYGDGATDFKFCKNITSSYNVFNNCKKTGLVGGSNSNYTMNVTFHHNFYNNVGSRLPLGRQANMHFYNNYYYNCSTCQDIRANAFVLSEANYFESCSSPQKVTIDDKDYLYTVIKSYQDYFDKCSPISTSSSVKNGVTTTVNPATIVNTRTQKLDGLCKPNGSTDYTNFDVDKDLFYYDSTNKKSDVSILNDVLDVPEFVKANAGAGVFTNIIFDNVDTTEYTVTFETNGGSTVGSQTVRSGKTISYVEPTKSGYIFDGWYTDDKLNTKFDSSTPITSDLTLYAKWAEEITISFNSNEGSSISDIKIAKDSSIATLPTPTKNGYKFDGWYLESNLTTKVTTSTTFSSNQKLYANWIEKGNNTVLTLNDFETGVFESNITSNGVTLTVKSGKASEVKTCNTTIENTAITKYVSFAGAGNYSQISIQFTTNSTSNITVYYAGGSNRYAALYNESGKIATATTATTGTGASNIVSYTFENIEAGSYAITSAGSSMEFYVIVIA